MLVQSFYVFLSIISFFFCTSIKKPLCHNLIINNLIVYVHNVLIYKMVPYCNKLCTLCIKYGGQLTDMRLNYSFSNGPGWIFAWVVLFKPLMFVIGPLIIFCTIKLSYLTLTIFSLLLHSPYFHNSTPSTSTFTAISGNISCHLWWCPLTETLPSVLKCCMPPNPLFQFPVQSSELSKT